MLEPELFALLEQTADAAFTVTESGEICSWNEAAEQLFGYAANEVLGRNIDEVTEALDTLGTRAFAGGTDSATRHSVLRHFSVPHEQTPVEVCCGTDGGSAGIPNFDLEVHTKSLERIWVNIFTIVFDNRRTGRRVFVRLARGIENDRQNEELVTRMLESARQLVALAHDPSHHATVESLSEPRRESLSKDQPETRSRAVWRRSVRLTVSDCRLVSHNDLRNSTKSRFCCSESPRPRTLL